MTPCHCRLLLLVCLSVAVLSVATANNDPPNSLSRRQLRAVSPQRQRQERDATESRLDGESSIDPPPEDVSKGEKYDDGPEKKEETAVHESSSFSVEGKEEGDDSGDNGDLQSQAKEEATVKERESTSVDETAPEEDNQESMSTPQEQQQQQQQQQQQKPVPTATEAEREAEDPLLAQEESASTILMDISLSIAAQRFLGLAAAIAGMLFTAYSVSENPDGLYASLCRSILTGFRVLCRVLTCKACFFGDGRRRAVHQHIPLDTWSVDLE